MQPRQARHTIAPMKTTITIGLIGDYSPAVTAHVAIPRALDFAARRLGCTVLPTWIPTDAIGEETAAQLAGFDALWCVPASPYASMDGALRAIRYAREAGRPFLGTCGGFQHALIEYARNVLGLAEADHAESNPEASLPLIAPLACSLVEKSGSILLQDGSRVKTFYARDAVVEQFHCSFGVNPTYQSRLADARLHVTGVDADGHVRVVELAEHPFFIATLFQPERSALRGEHHPLIEAFVRSAAL